MILNPFRWPASEAAKFPKPLYRAKLFGIPCFLGEGDACWGVNPLADWLIGSECWIRNFLAECGLIEGGPFAFEIVEELSKTPSAEVQAIRVSVDSDMELLSRFDLVDGGREKRCGEVKSWRQNKARKRCGWCVSWLRCPGSTFGSCPHWHERLHQTTVNRECTKFSPIPGKEWVLTCKQ